MPVPESSYSRRYGREDSTFSSTSSYSRNATSALGGGRSYSSYSKLSSSTLPPRPPAYEYRKYSTTTTDTPSRFLSSSASRVGGGYRSSVSPVRATASSIRRQLEASAPSIAERIKQMELGEANDETAAPSSTSRLSRFSSRSRDSQKSGSSYVPSSSYSTRERSASRDFSAINSSLKSTGSGSRASPLGGGGLSRTRSGSGSTRNGLSRRLSSIEVTSENTESDDKAFATTTNTSPTTKLDLDNCHSSFPSNLNSPDLEVKVVNSASTNSSSSCVMGVVSSGSVVVEREEEDEEKEENKDSNGNPIAPPPSLQSGSGIRLLEGVVGDKSRDKSSSPSPHPAPSTTKCESDSNANDLQEKSSRKLCNGEASKTERKKTGPKVIYHTIQVEDPPSCSPSPEPVYTLTARPSLDGTGPNIIQIKNVTKKKATPISTESVSAEFKVTLPKVKIPPEDKEVVPDNKPLNNGGPYEKELQENGETSEDQDSPCKKKEPSPPPAVTVPTTNGTTEKREKSKSKSRETTPVSKVKVSNGEVENINNSCSTDNAMGPHSSKYYHITSNGGFQKDASLLNRNERHNGRHTTTSDSSDNPIKRRRASFNISCAQEALIEDSDVLSSSPQLSTGGKFRSSKDTGTGHEKAGLTGLRNIGNTCFMNAVLQCLSNSKPLLEYVVKDNYEVDINRTTSGMRGALMRAFGDMIRELWRGEQRVVDTSAFKDQIQRFAPRFMGYSQQDAQEFLRYLLEGLHEDVNRITAKPTPITTDIDDSLSDNEKATESWRRYMRYESSKIVDMFVGQFKSTLKCTVCGHCSVTFDPFWDLSLPIPSRSSNIRLAQCFELLTKEETLDGDEKPTCAKCLCRRKCTKSLSIQKFPKILVVHLKRFSLAERFRGKLSTLVDYPLNGFDLTPFSAAKAQIASYNLYGVANHSGSTYSGHYVASCKHPYSGEWHSYNDSRVSPISSHSVVSSEGYVLFYEQRSSL